MLLREFTVGGKQSGETLKVTGSLYLGAAYIWTGDYRQAEDLLAKVLPLLEGGLSRERFGLVALPAVMARGYQVVIFSDQGRFKKGIAHGEEAIRLAEAFDHPYSLSAICSNLAYLQIAKGEPGHAIPLLERGLAVSREWNLTMLSVLQTGSLGYAYTMSGRTAEGFSLLESALSALETMRFGEYQSLFLVYLGRACVRAERLVDALEFAGRALTRAREGGQRCEEARALQLLGEVTARHGPTRDADGHYRDALALAEEIGMRPLVAHCHLGLGKLYRHKEHFTIATTMYREMEMTYWLEQAEAEMTG